MLECHIIETVCLNVIRHPVIPIRRGHETYDQRLDPAFRVANDDIHPVDGPAGIRVRVPLPAAP